MSFELTSDKIEKALDTFGDILAYDALECLCLVFNCGNARIWTDTKSIPLCDLYDLLDIYTGIKASTVKLSFNGGPPNRISLFEGSLYTMLVDFFLFHYVHGHESVIIKALDYAPVGCTSIL
jgi:hypothetical protein